MAETSFDGAPSGRAGNPAPTHITFEGGQRLLVEEVRHGGMGSVHIGTLAEGHSRIAAKSFREDLFFNTAARVAFFNETSIWSRLTGSAFVLPLFATWRSKNITYLIMPAVSPTESGEVSLRDRVSAHPDGLEHEEVFSSAMAIATAMAHSAKVVPGIVHGDLKPENILLFGGMPHVTDFGISVAGSHIENRAGVMGSTPYLAPECFDPDHPLSVASDVYAFGCIVYEGLTAAQPFGSDPDPAVMAARHRDRPRPKPRLSRVSPLADALLELGTACMALVPEDRPKDFADIIAFLLPLGRRFAPLALTRIIKVANEYSTAAESARGVFEDNRIAMLMQNGDYDEALRILDGIPESARTPRHWVWAGSANSLLNNDQAALECYERCLATGPDAATAIRCKSEMGLSLRRLKRHDEAIELFRSILGEATDLDLKAVSANLTGTLLDAGKLYEATDRSAILTMQYPDSSEIWTLDGQIKVRRGDIQAARASFRRAVNLDPANLPAQIALADLLAIEDGDLGQALAQLDIAFTQGQHTPDLFVRLIAVNILLGNTADAAGLLDLLKAAPSETADALAARTVEYVKKVADRHLPDDPKRLSGMETQASAKAEPPRSRDGQPLRNETAERGSVDAAAARAASGGNQDTSKLFVHESAILLREGSRLPMIGCRAYLGPNFFAMDYYDELGAPNYAEQFAAAFRKFTRELVLRQGPLSLRNSPFRFIRCTRCAFTVFSNRGGEEQLLCRMCEQRGPLSPVGDPDLDRLATRCESEGELVRASVSGMPVVFAVVPTDLNCATRVIAVCEQLGWVPVDGRDAAGLLLRFFAMQRGLNLAEEKLLMFTKRLPQGETRYDGTPLSVQDLLVKLIGTVGQIPTASIVINALEAEISGGMPALVQRVQEENGRRPTDPEEARVLVAFSEQIADRDHPQLESARALFALKRGQYRVACELFEKVKARLPLDFGARAGLSESLQSLGMNEAADRELRELRAIGYRA